MTSATTDTGLSPTARDMVPLALAAAMTTVAAIALWRASPTVLLVTCGIAGALLLASAAMRRPEVAIIALVGASALDVTGRIAQIGPLKVTLYQALLALTMVFAAWRVKTGRSRIQPTPIDIPVFLFLVAVAVSGIVAVEPGYAVVAFVSFASSAILVYLTVTLVDTPSAMVRVVLAVLGIAVLYSVLTLLESREIYSIGTPLYSWGIGVRPKVTFKDPNILGDFLMVASMLALPLFAAFERIWVKAAVVAAVAFCAFAVYTTGSRGALGALIVAFVVSVALIRIPLKHKLALLLVAVVAIAMVAAFIADPAWLQEKVLGVDQDESALSRVFMARSALEMAADHPFGVGGANYPVVYPWYRDGFVRWNLVESHTMVLTLLVEFGVVGLALFAWVLWRFASRVASVALKARAGVSQYLATGALAAAAGVIAQSFTYSLETSKFLWLTVGVGLAVYTMWRRETEETS